tara:strand:- start:4021 stop:5307 length:1287 start_codon:yes stop_codon:yes gene_type:complete
MNIKKKINICFIIFTIISIIFIYAINNNNFYYKIYEKKLMYEKKKILNNYKINNRPLKILPTKALINNVKISKYKTFEKNYLLLKLSEFDVTINNKSFIEKKDDFVIITLKSKNQKDNEFIKKKLNELIINETVEIINKIIAVSFDSEILSINKKLNDSFIMVQNNIANQHTKNTKNLELISDKWSDNYLNNLQNINSEIKKIRSIIIDKNNKFLELLKIKDSEKLEYSSEKSEIFNRCLDSIGEDLNKMLLNKNYENTVLFQILALNKLCNSNFNNIIEKKIFLLNSSDLEIFRKNKAYNLEYSNLNEMNRQSEEDLENLYTFKQSINTEFKKNMAHLDELSQFEKKFNENFFRVSQLLDIKLDLDELSKEIKKSQIILNNSNEYDIEYFNLKHEKWKIITIFLILNFLLVYLFIYRQLEKFIKIIR